MYTCACIQLCIDTYTYTYARTYIRTYTMCMCVFLLYFVLFSVEGKREREEKEREEEETEAFPSAIFQKAGSVQQNAPPILKGKDWLIGEVEEDGEEGGCSGLVVCEV